MRFIPASLAVGGVMMAALPTTTAQRSPNPAAGARGELAGVQRLFRAVVRAATSERPWTDISGTAAVSAVPIPVPSRATAPPAGEEEPRDRRPGSLTGSAFSPPPRRPRRAAARGVRDVRDVLAEAARRAGLDPGLVLAVSYWESGWDQTQVSSAGAVGLMQVEPDTARWAGQALLHRRVDIHSESDNALVGAAVLESYLDEFGDLTTALEAYNQGPTSIRRDGVSLGTRAYAEGIEALAQRIDVGAGPAISGGR